MSATETLAEKLMEDRLRAERVLATGTVKSFSVEDACGFISPDEGDDDLPVEAPSIVGGSHTLTTGTRVAFEVCVGRKGLQAVGVVPTDR